MIGNGLKRYLISSSAMVGLVVFAACASARADQTFNYVFSGAAYSGNGDTANLSGTFTWDATTDSVTASNIDLTGSEASMFGTEPVNCFNCSTGIYDGGGEYFAINLGSQALYITFADSLSLGENDPLSLVAPGEGNQPEFQGGAPFTDVTGSADIDNPTPEPSSLLLLASGMLGLLIFVFARTWRASRSNVASM